MFNKDKIINNKNVVSLFIVLALILIITSSIVCYIIGKNSGLSRNGKIIDTIIIEEPQNTDELPVYLTGKVSYLDGTPYHGTIRIFSKIQETKTNENGSFIFKNIEYGKHTIFVVNDNGNVISEMNLIINQSTIDNKILISKNDDGYEISVGMNIALIEININFDNIENEIVLNEEDITVVDYNGNVITPNNISSIQMNVIETINGNKIIPEGVIVLPNIGVILSNGIFISSTGQIHYTEDETNLPNDYNISNDGSVTLPNKTIIKPDGTIIRPDNEESKPVGNNNYKKKDDSLSWNIPIVKQGNMRWNQLSTLDLFATNDSTIDGKLYPGVRGEYQFSIENTNPYDILFSIDMKEHEHQAGNINLSYRLKYYDEKLNEYIYVIGNNNNYLKPIELSTTNKVTLLSNSNITYILEWIWNNENNIDQDLKDGQLGTSNDRVHYIDMKIYIENA